MRIFITGATGLIGRRLLADRLARGDDLVLLSRDAARAAAILRVGTHPNILLVEGNPTAPGDWQREVAGCDAVINLAGAGITDHRWTKKYKQALLSSRTESTRNVVDAIARAPMESRPLVLINASAIGYYGNAGDDVLDENSPPGNDFLAQLVMKWEHQARRVELIENGPRLVLLRTGIVLDPHGGALEKMTTLTNLFLGGPLGSGRQWMSWIHWRDLVRLIDFALENAGIAGPINAVSPHSVKNRDFAGALGRALHRPAFVPTPRFALRAALGEVADAALSSQRVVPAQALGAGFTFQWPELGHALKDLVQ